jgi:hypothetical protein
MNIPNEITKIVGALGAILVLASCHTTTAQVAFVPGAKGKYAFGKAYYIPPETTTEESGYFGLCEGKNGKIYIGTAAYGRNAYLVEFDPATEKMRVVIDVHKVLGLPLQPTGYAAQAKIHTRNFVGASGTIYVGTKQGYVTAAEKNSGNTSRYVGGYVLTYDPETDIAKSLGMPMPFGDPRLPDNATEGEGVIDVVADEERGLIYVITCEHQYWMVYDVNQPEKGYRQLGPTLRDQPNTLIDKRGRATAITVDYKIARFDPQTDETTIDALLVDGVPFLEVVGDGNVHPDWRLAKDGKTAYLQTLNDPRLFVIDLSGKVGRPVNAVSLGPRIIGNNPDSRSSLSIGEGGRVYSLTKIDNTTGVGGGHLHHLTRYDPQQRTMTDLGPIAVSNPDFFDFTGGKPWTHGFHTLPGDVLSPLHHILAMIVARDGTVYCTILYPFTLLQIPPQ